MCRFRGSGRRAGLKACATFFLLLLAACRRGPSIDDEAREYVRLAVALGERDPDSLDFYAGPEGAAAHDNGMRSEQFLLPALTNSGKENLPRVSLACGRVH
jgi:plasmid stability protein